MRSLLAVAAVTASLLVLSPASAHHLWIEADGSGAKIFFGEFGENLREASPGTLDKIEPKARIVTPAGERPLDVRKTGDGFAVPGRFEASDSIVAEDTRYPLFSRTRDGSTTRSIYWPAARLVGDRTPRAAVLDLDVVPIAGDRFQVVFKGKPLPKAKVEVLTPSGWGREAHTGEDGSFSVALPWRGIYVFEVQHTDRTAGKRGEDAYDTASYVTSLTVMQPQGLEPLPPPPPAKPH